MNLSNRILNMPKSATWGCQNNANLWLFDEFSHLAFKTSVLSKHFGFPRMFWEISTICGITYEENISVFHESVGPPPTCADEKFEINSPLNFCANNRSRFVHNCIDFFDNIKVSFVVGVLDSSPTPWNVGQLAGGKCGTNTVKS